MLRFAKAFFATVIFSISLGKFSMAEEEYIMCWQFDSEAGCLSVGCSWDPGKQTCS